MDLHSHSVHMAEAAMRLVFELLAECPLGIKSDGQVLKKSVESVAEELLWASSSRLVLQLLAHNYSWEENRPQPDRRKVTADKEGGGIDIVEPRLASKKAVPAEKPVKDLIIIVGKGSRLREAIQQLLSTFRPPLNAYTMNGNKGRLVVPHRQLMEWITIHRGLKDPPSLYQPLSQDWPEKKMAGTMDADSVIKTGNN